MNINFVLLLALSSFGSMGVQASVKPIAIRSVDHAGNGCPMDRSVTATIEGSSKLKLTLPPLRAVHNRDEPTSQRSVCRVIIAFDCPTGAKVSLGNVEYAIVANLSSGASGMTAFEYYFQGVGESETSERLFKGPLTARTKVSVALDRVWSSCNRALNLSLSVRVSPDGATRGDTLELIGPVFLALEVDES